MSTDLNIEEPAALLAYLRARDRIESEEEPVMRALHGGVSNRTVLVERASGEAWVLKQALAKLRVPVDWFSSPERVHREAEGLRWLQRLALPRSIPDLIFEDREEHLLAMQAVPLPHDNWKTLLLDGQVELDLVDQFSLQLATIHGNAYRRRSEVAPAFADRSFFESLRLEPYYGYTAEQLPAARAFLTQLMADCRQRTLTLVHGDYSPKNILVHNGRLILLDHEVIHWGDPAFDVGFSMTHFLSKAHHLPARRDAFAAAGLRYWDGYLQQVAGEPWADELEAHSVRHTMGCLLARVAGRSPLEYLDDQERATQRAAVVALVSEPPTTMKQLIDGFLAGLS